MADLEGPSSNTIFEVLEEWNTVLLAERYLLEQALASPDEPPIGDGHFFHDGRDDQRSIFSVDKTPADPTAALKGAAKSRGMKR